MKNITCFVFACLVGASAQAQNKDDANQETILQPFKNIEYKAETQVSASNHRTPLWLNANKYGLSSLESTNGYVRVGVERALQTDSAKRWAIGYGLDVVAPWHYNSKLIVQQAYAEVRWLHGALTVGSKEMPMELKNNRLSSGGQTFGINARTIPQVRLSLPQYWQLPLTNGWIHFKGYASFGQLTDDNWQETFTKRQSKYSKNVLYHAKAGYIKIGKNNAEKPLSLELGLEMSALFGGSFPLSNAQSGTNFRDYLHAFLPGGHEINEKDIVYKNVEGDHLGSWLVRLNYETANWKASVYADKFFEDHSSMLQLDFDGYGEGEKWDERTRNKYLLYDFKDILLGAKLNLKNGSWLRNIVVEYVYTKYQSGPIYHDRTKVMADHIGGVDQFYNHSIYSGWQHWGQVIGNPLYLSPQYNSDGRIEIKDNRFVAYHLGVEGNVAKNINYRFLSTYRCGLGTYHNPYANEKKSVHLLLETNYAFKNKWFVGLALGLDKGKTMGNNYGLQLTITKKGVLK